MSLIHKIHGSCLSNKDPQLGVVRVAAQVVVGKLLRVAAGRYAVTGRPQGGGVCGEGGVHSRTDLY